MAENMSLILSVTEEKFSSLEKTLDKLQSLVSTYKVCCIEEGVKSADIAKIQQNKEMFNPKLITAWNEKWNLDLGGSNIEKTSVHGQSFNKSDQLISLVEEAQQHTRDVSEGRKTRA